MADTPHNSKVQLARKDSSTFNELLTVSVNGDNEIIATPGAGYALHIHTVTVQNKDNAVSTEITFKSASTEIQGPATLGPLGVWSVDFFGEDAIVCAANEAFVVNSSVDVELLVLGNYHSQAV